MTVKELYFANCDWITDTKAYGVRIEERAFI